MESSFTEKFCALFGSVVKGPFASGDVFFVCPDCGHKALSCNTLSGKFHCFRCGFGRGRRLEGAPATQPKSVVNLEVQNEILNKLKDSGHLIQIHRDYLKERGVYNPDKFQLFTIPMDVSAATKGRSSEELVASGLFYYGFNGELRRCGFIEPGRICIPHWRGNTIVGWKTRLSPYREGVPYLKPLGAKDARSLWYKTFGADTILTEGELKAIVAIEVGIPACCISGIANWRACLQINRWSCQRVFIVLDSDPGLLESWPLINAAVQMQESVRNSCIAFLPQEKIKVDIDSFIVRYGVKSLKAHLEDSWSNRATLYKRWVEVRNEWLKQRSLITQ